jgi:cell division protein FtsQ
VRGSTLPPPPNRRRSAPPPARAPRASRPPSAFATRTRAVLRRVGTLAVRVLVAGGIIATLIAIGLFLHHYVTSSDHFEIRDITLEGAERVTRDDILRAGGINAGENVFAVDPDDAAARIRRLPWIRSVTVQRKLPGEVHVQVEERRAAALIELEGLYLVDAEGTIFKRLGEHDPEDLPVITGLPRQAVIEHPEGAREAIQEALGLLAEYRDVGLETRVPASEVHREGATGWTLILAENGTRVRLGTGPYRAKLGRLGRLLQELNRRRLDARIIHLDNRVRQDRATVELRAPDPAGEGGAG